MTREPSPCHKVTIGSGETTISSTAKYTDDGNFQISSTDALGKTTFYGYNVKTGMLEWVQYPEDSDGSDGELDTRTKYTYDSMCRQATAVCQIGEDQTLSASYEYTDDYLTTIRTPTTTYNFEYGVFGLRKSVKVGSQELAGYTYNQDWYLDKLTYGNDDFVQYEYDKKGRLESQTYEDGDKVSYTYNNDGDLATVTDETTGITTTYYYDLLGRQMKYVEKDDGFTHSVGYEYDKDNNLAELVENINGTERTTSYEYDDDNRVTSVTTDGTTVEYTYDDYGRISQQVTKNGNTTILTESFTYTGDTDAKTTSSQIATYTTTAGSPDADGYSVTYTYTYDDNGNITSISDGTNTVAYQYDSANQLIQEHYLEAEYGYLYGYNEGGNLTHRYHCFANEETNQLEVAGEVFYSYDNSAWGDLLTAYDDVLINYDQIGNPETFGDRSFTWEHGRQLKSLTEGTTTWNYTYDASGMRTGRTDGTTSYQYIYTGSQLMQMTVDTDGDDEIDITLTFTYDASGVPLTVTHGSNKYYYATNIQGDVVAILNADGTTAASYTYDAWGICLNSYTSGIGFLNPLRYRGYVYDQETGLYYLQSRYYDPMVGRFVNADDYIFTNQGLLSLNTFAYCHNNPICCIDKSGTFPWLVVGIVALVVVAIGVDHWLASSQPEGGYAVASESSDNATIKGIYAEGNGFEIGANGMTLCDTEVGLLSYSIEGEYAEIVPLDCFTASASAAVDWSSNPSIEASAVASIYSPSVEVNIPFGFFNITFSAEALIGAVGIGVELDPMSGKFKITPPTLGIGGTYSIDFNLAN